MWFTKNLKKSKREKGSISLEAAVALPLVLLIFLQLGLSLHAVAAELSISAALQRLSKESNLVLAAQRQVSAIVKAEEKTSSEATDNTSYSKTLSAIPLKLLQDAAISKLSAPLLAERLNLWFGEHYTEQVNFSIINEAKIFFETPKASALGRLHLFYKIPGIWQAVDRSQSVLLNDWRGFNAEIESAEAEEQTEATVNLWAWDNFSRGKAFQKKYGANLGSFHPVVAKSHNGAATMIKSIDLTTKTYQNLEQLKNTVDDWIYELTQFSGSEETGRIFSKTILIIVPENSPYKQLQLLESKKNSASARGIKVEIVRDGISGQETVLSD